MNHMLQALVRCGGGTTAAALFSMAASCERHDIDLFRYLADVLLRFPTTPSERLTKLLLDAWSLAHLLAARKRAA